MDIDCEDSQSLRLIEYALEDVEHALQIGNFKMHMKMHMTDANRWINRSRGVVTGTLIAHAICPLP